MFARMLMRLPQLEYLVGNINELSVDQHMIGILQKYDARTYY
jgi:hypothetical protein